MMKKVQTRCFRSQFGAPLNMAPWATAPLAPRKIRHCVNCLSQGGTNPTASLDNKVETSFPIDIVLDGEKGLDFRVRNGEGVTN